MEILLLLALFGPVLGATLGYLVDGPAGAASGFGIPAGPLLIAWLFGGPGEQRARRREPARRSHQA